jgi:N-acetylglucosaminyldiphosphoundecaprenol N-acetyl-beta-D-mannosaminyltransferase
MICGVQVHPLRLDEVLAWTELALAGKCQALIAYANVHAINLAQSHAPFRAALNSADIVFCDGQGLRVGAALLGYDLPERFTPPDWIDRLIGHCAAEGHAVFLVGGRPGVAERAAVRLRMCHPALQIAAHHGYFHGASGGEDEAAAAIREFRPALVLVGMGMPLQECWAAAQRAAGLVPVVMTVGALFDYLAGDVGRGPRWLTDNGLEWLCRLWYEPRRLWQRYLIGNPAFLMRIAREMIAMRLGRR